MSSVYLIKVFSSVIGDGWTGSGKLQSANGEMQYLYIYAARGSTRASALYNGTKYRQSLRLVLIARIVHTYPVAQLVAAEPSNQPDKEREFTGAPLSYASGRVDTTHPKPCFS